MLRWTHIVLRPLPQHDALKGPRFRWVKRPAAVLDSEVIPKKEVAWAPLVPVDVYVVVKARKHRV